MQCSAILDFLLTEFCVLLLALWSVVIGAQTICQHEAPDPVDVVTRVSVDRRRLFIRSLSSDQLRIHIHYDESITVLNDFDFIRVSTSVLLSLDLWKTV